MACTEEDRLRDANLQLKGLVIQHHECSVCGISSEDTPLFAWTDGRWLCGPFHCGMPKAES